MTLNRDRGEGSGASGAVLVIAAFAAQVGSIPRPQV